MPWQIFKQNKIDLDFCVLIYYDVIRFEHRPKHKDSGLFKINRLTFDLGLDLEEMLPRFFASDYFLFGFFHCKGLAFE